MKSIEIFLYRLLCRLRPRCNCKNSWSFWQQVRSFRQSRQIFTRKKFFNEDQHFERIEVFSQDYLANISSKFQAYKSHFSILAHMDEYLSRLRLKFNAAKSYWEIKINLKII
ncbi:unnamed protein product [Blepharisma stoltei]|uniref:Uncharacterized protein n=1 Tax=Blepharisma stoltei TaxID=1481888 RepID=A0AAU9JSA8_9CILI|nr:unnamed protein product [Blepharisma stoltei]